MERIGTLLVAPSTERKAEPGQFATALKAATAGVAAGLSMGASLAAPFVPGGAVLAGALRATATQALPAGGPGPSTGSSSLALPATGPGTTAGLAASVGLAAAAGAARAAPSTLAPTAGVAGTGGGDLLEATRALQLQSQSFNLQYLELQEAMQRESREFTAMSNVMKVRHDSAKAAITNIH